jgi:gamma-glutamyl:cysteine ligase YbdK (ATP-grasp superfamily)
VGLEIEQESFAEDAYASFAARLSESLEALEGLLARPGFGEGEPTVGAELEVSLVDADARPLPANRAVLAESRDPRLTFELDRFNLECNLRHAALRGRPFTALHLECRDALDEMRRAAARHAGRVAMVGILPTLREADLDRGNMTDSVRYRALSAGLRRLRRQPFRLDIHGEDDLELLCDDVTFEGAATSLQLHLRVAPADFARTFNAAQLATIPVLAVAGNSPTFLGRRLWEETRVALFKQAVDSRAVDQRGTREARVSFGRTWIEGGALEIFRESVALHPPLLPVLADEDPRAVVDAGALPALQELRLHQGTVWSWNRPIYDPAEGGHLRIEMRALPAGPTLVDMLANAAFQIGLTLGLMHEADAWVERFPFSVAHDAFYRAAQAGLAGTLPWPNRPGEPPVRRRVPDLVLQLLDVAQYGLDRAGVERWDSAPLLELIERRARAGRTGAAWQRHTLATLERKHSRSDALAAMLERYLTHSQGGEPVHAWPLA